MKFKQIIIGAVVILSAIGCAKAANEGSANNVSKVVESSPMPNPNGSSDYGYYNQFLYSSRNCDGKKLRLEFAASAYESALKSNTSLRVLMNLYLSPSGVYAVEIQIKEFDTSKNRVQTKEAYWKSGRWFVDRENLILEDLGVGYRSYINRQQGITLEISSSAIGELYLTEVYLIRADSGCQ